MRSGDREGVLVCVLDVFLENLLDAPVWILAVDGQSHFQPLKTTETAADDRIPRHATLDEDVRFGPQVERVRRSEEATSGRVFSWGNPSSKGEHFCRLSALRFKCTTFEVDHSGGAS